MEERVEETPAELSKDSIQDLITSKNFKNRILAYQNISQFPELVGHLQNETLAVALEVALDSLLSFAEPLSDSQISALYSQFGQSKSGIKTKLSELVDRVFLNDQKGVIKGLAEMFTHKSPKVVSSCVGKVNILIKCNIELFSSREWKKILAEDVCSKLELLFGSTDKDVKSEATALTIVLSHIFLDGIYKFIENVKPIILRDLKDALKSIEVPKKHISLGELQFDHPDWKERLNCMNFLKENIGRMSNASEAYLIVCRKTKDVNLSVVIATVETIRNGRISHSDCVRGMIERFKDKRSALSALIKESVGLIKPDINILVDSLDNKNPEVKAGVLECLSYYDNISRVKDVAKMLEDSSADVRSRAIDALSRADDLSELTEFQKLKISKSKKPMLSIPKTDAAASVNPAPTLKTLSARPMPAKALSSPVKAILEPAPTSSPSKFDFSLDSAAKSRIYESFVERYPLFLEKDWNKRLEYLQERRRVIEREDLGDLCMFLISCKESNFYILKELLGIFEGTSRPLPPQLCSYLSSKITETKLRDDIVAIFKKLDSDLVVQSFIYQLKMNKSGKKCISFLEIFGMLVTGSNHEIDEFLKTFKCVGISEKKALAEFIGMYEKSKHTAPKKIIDAEQPTMPVNARPKDSKVSDDVYRVSNIQESTRPTHPVQILKTNIDSCRSKEFKTDLDDVFTSEFLDIVEHNPFSGVSMLESVDVILLSDAVIQMYCKFDLPSPYFNSLILHFISKKYILREEEAVALVAHLLDKRMESELELIDRIYPATKLYKILRRIPGEESIKTVLHLLFKYKRIGDFAINEVERVIRENEDFIGFTMDMDKLVALKLEMREKFMKEVPREIASEAVENCFSKDYTVPNTNTSQRIGPSTDRQNAAVGHEIPGASLLDAKLEYQNGMQEDNDSLDYLENSFVIENSAVDEGKPISLGESPSILKAPSVAIKDSLLETDKSSFVRPPSILETNLFSDIERSLDNISITTTPRRKKRNFDEIEEVLHKINREDVDVSKDALTKLSRLISENPESLLFSSNTVIGSIMVQLMDKYDNQDFRSMSLAVLLRFTQNVSYCSSLRYETLKSIHVDLISVVKENTTVADILINLCLNCDVQLLRVYFDLLEHSNEILMKLIWRHSKRVDYSSMETVAVVMRIVDSFYATKKDILARAENVLLKVCLLHLKECVSSFSDNVKEFGVGGITEDIVNLLIGSKDLSLDKVRECFRQ